MNKRTTIYLDPDLHRALRIKVLETERSVSELINEAVRQAPNEYQEDLQAFEQRAAEPMLSCEAVHRELKEHGKL